MPQRIALLGSVALLLTLATGCYDSRERALFPPSMCAAGEPTLLVEDESCVQMTFVPRNTRPLCAAPGVSERGSGFRVINEAAGPVLVRLTVLSDGMQPVAYGEQDPSSCDCRSVTHSLGRSTTCFAGALVEAGATLEWTVTSGGVPVRVDACPAPDVIGAFCD